MKSSIHLCNLARISTRIGPLGLHEFVTEDHERMYYKFPTLKELHWKLFEEIPSGLHDSMVDVEVCLKCYLIMIGNQGSPMTPPLFVDQVV